MATECWGQFDFKLKVMATEILHRISLKIAGNRGHWLLIAGCAGNLDYTLNEQLQLLESPGWTFTA